MAEQRKVPFVTLATFNTTPASEPAKKRRREDENDTSHGKNGGVGSAGTGPGGGGGSSLFGNIEGNVNVTDGTSGEPKTVTVRLNISLSEPSEKGSAEFNYSELVQATQVSVKNHRNFGLPVCARLFEGTGHIAPRICKRCINLCI